MTITDLRESDAHTYRFRFYAGGPGGRYSGRGGVTLSVTDLKVTVSDTDGGVKKLNCSSTCTLPNTTTYIWYRNGQPVSGCESASCSVAVVSEVVSYSCAVKGSDLHPPPVYNRTSVYAASGGAVVLLLIFTAVFLWMRRRAAVTSSKTEKSSGEGASAPVYDEVSTLAVTSEPSRAASSDGQDDVQYSSVHFSRSQTKDVPLNSTVHPSNVLPHEEEVQYAVVNTAKPRTARNDETPIYSTVQKNIR
ncbi:uncharacterized protein LOC108413800 [Pygocentrus nattereri]|uniref:uncharacterized protein LOC108413800 n=1 Tax=Pygocentrus nattereri TaxID=42514 RepID=UPI00189133D7|nr:uncharacterized protein LOC108413800 [Pygocentrus nattereri]